MTDATANTAKSSHKIHSVRSNASRRLLARKALEKSAIPRVGHCIESSFPESGWDANLSCTPFVDQTDKSVSATAGPYDDGERPITTLANVALTAAPTWSDEDEAEFKALKIRRKAVGHRPRGRDVAAQIISVGYIKPNLGTVVAVIVELVAERGTVARAALIDAMASATFPHAKARPSDAGWSQGYVAGALRSGYLTACDATQSGLSDRAA